MKCWISGLLLAVCCGFPALGVDDTVNITVTGRGADQEAARLDALQGAIAEGGADLISANSGSSTFRLIRDTILARAEDLITSYKIVESGTASDGTRRTTITATFEKKVIEQAWSEMDRVLNQIGRPGVAIFIRERIDGAQQDSSILESNIEHRLLEEGFKVYAGDQLRAIAEKESADAAAEQNVAKMQAIAKNFGTQIFITGTASANAAGIRDLAGQAVAMYNGDAVIKMYYTDTAELLASESLANWRGGARGYDDRSVQAGKKALENAGVELVDRCYNSVMRRWATRISSGGEIVLEVEGVSLADAIRIKKRLRAIDPEKIRAVNQTMSKATATFHIKAKMTAEELAEYLVEEPWSTILEVVDLTTNRIQAKKVGG